jgi:hypothetical protein
MKEEQFKNLQRGDIVKHVLNSKGDSIVIMANYGGRVTAVRTYDLTNPDEWELVMKANHEKVK